MLPEKLSHSLDVFPFKEKEKQGQSQKDITIKCENNIAVIQVPKDMEGPRWGTQLQPERI